MYFFLSYSAIRHQVVKVVRVAKLVHIYLTRWRIKFEYDIGQRYEVPSICHIWYYTTLGSLPKTDTCRIFGCLTFQGRPQNTQITTINMYLLIEIMHNIIINCHGYYSKVD